MIHQARPTGLTDLQMSVVPRGLPELPSDFQWGEFLASTGSLPMSLTAGKIKLLSWSFGSFSKFFHSTRDYLHEVEAIASLKKSWLTFLSFPFSA
jgi:hypothetical protein